MEEMSGRLWLWHAGSAVNIRGVAGGARPFALPLPLAVQAALEMLSLQPVIVAEGPATYKLCSMLALKMLCSFRTVQTKQC